MPGEATRWSARVVGAQAGVQLAPMDDVLEHDVDWLVSQCDVPGKLVLVVEGSLGRQVPFFVHEGQIDFDLGELSFGRSRVRRHVLTGNFGATITEDEWERIFEVLPVRLGPHGVCFLLGVVESEPLECVLSRPAFRRNWRVVAHGPAYERRSCTLGHGLDEYLAVLPSGHRQDLRRSLRRFEREFAGRHECRVFTSEREVERFLDLVEPLSRLGYQARLRGLAITRRGHVGVKALEGARRGYTRCYLLVVDGRPIAWRIGYLYRGVFCSHHIGYDSEFERWHPGVVMHLESVRDLSRPEVGAHTLDLLYGDNDFKRKAADRSRRERNYFLFPRTLRGWRDFVLLSAFNGLSAGLGRVLARRGWKARITRWIRRGS